MPSNDLSSNKSKSSSHDRDNTIFFIPDLAIARFKGTDTVDFLQGYLTCDTTKIGDTKPTLWSICNIKGRAVANGWALRNDYETIDLILHNSLVDPLLMFFTPYLAFSNTEGSNLGRKSKIYGSREPLDGKGLQLAQNQYLHIFHEDNSLSDAPQKSPKNAERWIGELIRENLCLLMNETSGRFLPQMLGLTESGAINFDKGCYLGQEIIARAQHRGSVKRTLKQLFWTGTRPKEGDDIVTTDQTIIGTVINVDGDDAEGISLSVIANKTGFPVESATTMFQELSSN